MIVNLPRVEQIENFWEFFLGSECSEQVNKTDILILVVDQSCCITPNLYCLSIISSLHSSSLLDWPGITCDWSPMRINFRSMLEVSQKKMNCFYILLSHFHAMMNKSTFRIVLNKRRSDVLSIYRLFQHTKFPFHACKTLAAQLTFWSIIRSKRRSEKSLALGRPQPSLRSL